MKIELTLAMIFILLASSAFAAGSGGSVVIDIVGAMPIMLRLNRI
jgi:hypothetical protein